MSASYEWRRADISASAAGLAERIREAVPARRRVLALECDRGVPSLIAFTAALDAGCVPLLGSAADPVDRRTRLRTLSGAALTLSSPPGGDFALEPTGVPDAGPAPDAVYLAATSGSTGQPKVAAISRSVFDAYLTDVTEAYGLTADDRVLQFAPPGFDVFVEETLPAFHVDATVVVPPWSHAPAAAAFLSFLDETGTTVVNLPSSYWMGVADHLRSTGDAMPASVRLVVVGSEPVSRELVEWAQERMPEVRIVNAYGTSEVAPTCFVFDCAELPKATADPTAVPVGGPLPFLRYHIDDPADSPYGRLHLAPTGAGPQLPAFDTGDLASVGDDGYVYLHGRADLTRLKRGGVTVNAESLAACARECPGVLGATAQLDHRTDSLVLTVQSAAAPEDTAELVRSHLRAVLPPAWLPDRIQVATGYGGVAGSKLSVSNGSSPRPDGATASVESTVRNAWRDCIGAADIDADYDFFDGGGDSITAVRVSARLSDLLAHRVPVQLLFAHPRFGDFVDAVTTLLGDRLKVAGPRSTPAAGAPLSQRGTARPD